MASAKMKTLSAEKSRLSAQSDLLRYTMQRTVDELRGPAEWFERGYDFSFVSVGMWKVTAPWRRARRGRKWRTIPAVVTRFLRWKAAH